jgi:hypothetical protein
MINYYGIYKWNYLRNECKLSSAQLETDMFNEEYLEWRSALCELLDVEFGDTISRILADVVDAYCDMNFVLQGSKAKGDFDARKDRILEYVYETTVSCLLNYHVQNPWQLLEEADSLVLHANSMKPIKKTTTKIEKGLDWIDPKIEILNLIEKSSRVIS